ncbi:uncharacterized protein TNCV_2893221 [Trichonephila clavipes]|nr:uncharacterized protein TNCV_2893221 [Trichonephila clavipes]
MYKDTKNFVRSCTVCLSRKNTFKILPVPHQPVEQSQEPGETCHIDIFSPLKTTPKDGETEPIPELETITKTPETPGINHVHSLALSLSQAKLIFDLVVNCQVIYSQFGLAIHQNDHQARYRFVEWTQNEIAVVPDFHKRILFSDEAHFWLNGYVNKQNYRIWSEANPQVYVETPLHPEKLTVWCALWAGGILLQKR